MLIIMENEFNVIIMATMVISICIIMDVKKTMIINQVAIKMCNKMASIKKWLYKMVVVPSKEEVVEPTFELPASV